MFSILLRELFGFICSNYVILSGSHALAGTFFHRRIFLALSHMFVCVLCVRTASALSCCRDLLLSFLSTVREAADSGRYPSIPLTQLCFSDLMPESKTRERENE